MSHPGRSAGSHPPRTLDEAALLRWTEASAAVGANVLGRGYQGQVYLYADHDPPLVIKAALGRGPVGWARRWMLRNEYRAYTRLAGLPGVPRCLGLVRGRLLLLSLVQGVPFRGAEIVDRRQFFQELQELIETLHSRQVAHGDLKKKDNLLVVDSRHPVIIDFGAAVVRRPGIAPFNHYLFRLARRFDINACIKLRLGHNPDDAAAQAEGYRRTLVERLSRAIKRSWLRLRG
ncbi:MAG: serine/threonine-protein kinase [Acidobacteriota bacterium]|nr:serine/threonine-protein kinase [Acidobacteriota bacterium]